MAGILELIEDRKISFRKDWEQNYKPLYDRSYKKRLEAISNDVPETDILTLPPTDIELADAGYNPKLDDEMMQENAFHALKNTPALQNKLMDIDGVVNQLQAGLEAGEFSQEDAENTLREWVNKGGSLNE